VYTSCGVGCREKKNTTREKRGEREGGSKTERDEESERERDGDCVCVCVCTCE